MPSRSAQDSAISGTAAPPGRPFPKGVSGNPGGRPRGRVRIIRAQTRDGHELAAFMLRVLRDEDARLADRMMAASWLADRAFGRPTQAVEHSWPSGRPVLQIITNVPRPERPGVGVVPMQRAAVTVEDSSKF